MLHTQHQSPNPSLLHHYQLSSIASIDPSSLLHSQTTKLHSYSDQIKQLLLLIQKYQRAANKNIKNLQDEFNSIHIIKHKLEVDLTDLDKYHSMQKNQYMQLKNQYIFKKKQRIAYAESINLQPLVNLEIEDRRSKCHEVFMWILTVVYKEPSGKYYWENFKEQAFKEDNGMDFIQRIGKMSVTDLREEEKIVTQKLLENRRQLEKCQEFQEEGVLHEVKKIIDIAQLFIDGYQISKKSKEIDKQDTKMKDQRILKEESVVKIRAKLNAVQDRKNLGMRYLRTLQSIEQDLKIKQINYSNLELETLKAIRELKSSNDYAIPTQSNVLIDVKVEIHMEEQIIF